MMSRPRRFWSSMRLRRVTGEARRSRSASLSSTAAMAQSGLPTTASAMRQRRLRGEQHVAAGVEAADEQVVDGVVDEVADVLDELEVALGIAGHAEAGEDLLAEAVGGGDRGGVEVGEGMRAGGRAGGGDLGRSAPAQVGDQQRRRSSRRPGRRAPARGRPRSRRSHTRSRSVPVALRVNVTTSSSSSGRPSATSATTSEATAWVLPVPGAGLEHGDPRPATRHCRVELHGARSGRAHEGRRGGAEDRVPQPSGQHAEPAVGDDVVEAALAAEHEDVLVVEVLLLASRTRSSRTLPALPTGSAIAVAARRGVRGTTWRSRAEAARGGRRRGGRRGRRGGRARRHGRGAGSANVARRGCRFAADGRRRRASRSGWEPVAARR